MSITDAIKQLSTEKGRIKAIVRALEKGLIDDPKYVREAINYLKAEHPSSFYRAARLAKKFGLEEEAIQLYEKAIGYMESRKDFFEAAELSEETGNLERALQNYENELQHGYYTYRFDSRKYKEVAEVALKAGSIPRAILFLERGGNWIEAGKLAESIGDYETALRLYEKIPSYQKLPRPLFALRLRLKLAKKEGDTKKIEQLEKELYETTLECYEKQSNPWEAIQLARKKGDMEKANEIYQRAVERYKKESHLYSWGVILAKKFGDEETAREFYDRAIAKYENLQMYGSIAKLAESMEDTRRARTYKTLQELIGY